MNIRVQATLVLVSMFFGCSSIETTNYLNQHNKEHVVKLDIEKEFRHLTKQVNLKHTLSEEDLYLVLSGKLYKPLGTNYTRANIKAIFMNDKDDVLKEEFDKVRLMRGPRTRRRQMGNFILKTKDNPKIVRCQLTIKWI